MQFIRVVLTFCAVIFSVSDVIAQCSDSGVYPPKVDDLICYAQHNDRNNLKLIMDISISPAGLAYIRKRILVEGLSQLGQSASQSIQNGSSSLSSASTSLVSKSITSLLGVAEEVGAISSTASGSTTTFTANPAHFVSYLNPTADEACNPLAPSCTPQAQLLSGLSVALSINSSAQSNGLSPIANTALAALVGSQNPVFSGLTVAESFHGRKRTDVVKSDFSTAVDSIDSATQNAVVEQMSKFIRDNANDAGYATVLSSCVENLIAANGTAAQTQQIESKCVKGLYKYLKDQPHFASDADAFIKAADTYDDLLSKALDGLFYRNTFSVEYDLTNNAAQPLLSTFKGVYGYSRPSKTHGPFQFTANGSATIYNSLEGSTGSRLRSAQGAAQLEWTPNFSKKLVADISTGYYFQYMVANGLLDLPSTALAPGTSIALPSGASTLLNTTGPIHIGQGKLTLSIKGTNFKIPIAVTGASRTDLIKTQDRVGANFGISYDFSSLFTK